MMRMERLKKSDINLKEVHHIAGGPYKGILVNKQADQLDTVGPCQGRVEFMAYLINSDHNNEAIRDRWTLRFWFRGHSDGITKKQTLTEYFSELISPKTLPRKYVGFVKRALVLLQRFALIKRLELEVEELDGDDDDLPPIKSFVSVFTPDSYTYRFVPEVPVETKTFLAFKIKAGCDANLSLCAIYGDVERKTYEICLGAENNSRSFIRDGSLGAIKSESHTVNLLNENEFRYFWISWADHHVQVGKGAKQGQDIFLSWVVPPNRQFKVNSMAVATSRQTKGQWEFAEIMDEKDLNKNKRNKIKLSLLWLAKKQKMLQVLEDAYPISITTDTLFRKCMVKQGDTITAVVMLKGMEKKGLVQEVEKGVWIRMQNKEEITEHAVHMVKDLPMLTGQEQPTIGLITTLYHEKLAVDAMMEDKRTYIKYKTESESQVYTLGNIGSYRVVSTKLARMGNSEADIVAAENTVTRLLGTFSQIAHVFMVGVGGAVPSYTDHNKHVRLGDVVVSTPADDTGAVYVYCSKVEKMKKASNYSYVTRVFSPSEQVLNNAVLKMKRQVESSLPTAPRPWDQHIEVGKDTLRGQESNFHRPLIQKDKLFYTKPDGEVIQVDHPRPQGFTARHHREGQTQVRYGVIACGQRVSRADPVRSDFALMNGVKAYQQEHDAVLESLEGNCCESYLVVLGMCDYADGSKKEWMSYAALAAAAYVKSLILTL
ncbi:hypothetical protein EGW08_013508 [Elysia chlorotica]|uniref:Farnesoic acid O-methyl transferase domain-containing protein n=1 Tax=Elysia chlorotica TaxID=188477 RepID=A0A3S1BA34_ELYCH|nr:hypothetical protein EGW08_013508 [Elysia chlorotica]